VLSRVCVYWTHASHVCVSFAISTPPQTVKNIANRPADAKLLEAYGLFKQVRWKWCSVVC
jgi:hypothetical protein